MSWRLLHRCTIVQLHNGSETSGAPLTGSCMCQLNLVTDGRLLRPFPFPARKAICSSAVNSGALAAIPVTSGDAANAKAQLHGTLTVAHNALLALTLT